MGIEELGSLRPTIGKIKLIAKIMPQINKTAATTSGEIKGSTGKEINTLLTYQDVAEKLIRIDGIVTQHRKEVVQRNFLSWKPMYPFTKTMFASPITK